MSDDRTSSRPAPTRRKPESQRSASAPSRAEDAVERDAKRIDLGLPEGAPESERIAKRIARAGVASRRDAEKLVSEGRVKLDGQVVESPALDVRPDQKIEIDGQPLPDPDRVRLFRYHKPPGVVVSAKDPEGRRTIYDHLPAGLPRLQPIGRLDMNTEGLLLLTNDGELKRKMELPATKLVRRYRARAFGNLQPQVIAQLRKGISIDGIDYGPMEVEEERRTGANLWLRIGLTEGKNREVRRVLEHVGLKVNRLIRIGYGPFALGQLAKQAVAEVPQKVLSETLGIGRKASGKVGTAKAKPKPTRPLSRAKAAKARAEKLAAAKSPGTKPAWTKRTDTKPGQPAAGRKTEGGRGSGDRSATERVMSDRPRNDGARNDVRRGGQPKSHHSRNDRPEGKPPGGKPSGGKPSGAKSSGPRPSGPRPAGKGGARADRRR